ncbi:MAG: hypothetical protein OEX00_01210 [Gammaproteobacteria bacterium]|nr:hypothetical protein [Gammaproteobacteria bacterium]MDH5692211.1 hypothetical protein [Gammaproteobacteria bacterium]
MSVYSTEKLVSEARKLATEFRRTTGKPLGISGEIAEFDAAHILDLELLKEKPGGYDAIGRGKREGQRVQIKGRAILNDKSGQRIGQLKTNQDWDLLVLVIMNEEYHPVEIWEADRETVEEALEEQKKNKNNKGAISLAKFKHIAKLAWSADEEPSQNTA